MSNESAAPSRSFVDNAIAYWLPVVAMIALMAFLSTDLFSGDNTQSVINAILREFWPGLPRHTVNAINHDVRKTAHFTEYAVFGALVFRALRADSRPRWKWSWFLWALCIVIAWSLVDELHQAFTLTRGASIYDSALDTCGGLFALGIIGLFATVRNSRDRAPDALESG